MKVCAACRAEKSVDDFGMDGARKDGRYPYCKACRNEKSANAYKNNKDYHRAYHRKNRSRIRDGILARTYGLRPGEYDEMLARQNGVCAICQQPEKIKRYGQVSNLCVDHDHATGQVRALLCLRCNYILGAADENTTTLRDAAAYLEAFRDGQ